MHSKRFPRPPRLHDGTGKPLRTGLATGLQPRSGGPLPAPGIRRRGRTARGGPAALRVVAATLAACLAGRERAPGTGG